VLLSEVLVLAFDVFFVVVFLAPFFGVLVVVVFVLSVVDVLDACPKARPAPNVSVIINISSFFIDSPSKGFRVSN
jgi:hypothetical protein